MEVKELTDEQVRLGYTPKGNLNGSFAEAQQYLGWVLSSKNTDNTKNFKEVIKVFSDKWNLSGLTTKYLKGLMDGDYENKNIKIRQLIDKAGYSLIPTKRYFREMRCIKGSYGSIVFGKDSNGKTTITEEKRETTSRTANVFVSEVLHKMIPKSETEAFEKQAIQNAFERYGIISNNKPFSFNRNKILLRDSLLEEVEKHQRYNPEEGHFWKQLPTIEGDTKRQFNAVLRLLKDLSWKDRDFVVFNCQECKHEIKVPIETKLELVSDIYQAVSRDIKEGIYFCPKCNEMKDKGGSWKEQAIKNLFEKIYNEIKTGTSCIGFKYDEFCLDYRFDKKILTPYAVRDKIGKLIEQFDLEDKMIVGSERDTIKIQITKKI
jgi:hypothetical protein